MVGLAAIEANLARRYAIKQGTVRFNTTDFAKFIRNDLNAEYPYSRKLAKKIISYELGVGRFIVVDQKRGVYRCSKPEIEYPPYVRNECGLVGKRFNELKVLKRNRILQKDFFRCHMCDVLPKFLQVTYYVVTAYGDAEVVMCPGCNKVVTEI